MSPLMLHFFARKKPIVVMSKNRSFGHSECKRVKRVKVQVSHSLIAAGAVRVRGPL